MKKVKTGINIVALLLLFAMVTGCGNKAKENNAIDTAPTETLISVATPKPTNSPLPTAEATITENNDGTRKYTNETNNYSIDFDEKVFTLVNENGTDKFNLSDTDDNAENTDIYVDIFIIEDTTLKDAVNTFCNQSQKASTENVTLGCDGYKATQIVISKRNPRQEYYLLEQSGKVWCISIKSTKKYDKKINAMLDSITFK